MVWEISNIEEVVKMERDNCAAASIGGDANDP
jgi:hypothetical protein